MSRMYGCRYCIVLGKPPLSIISDRPGAETDTATAPRRNHTAAHKAQESLMQQMQLFATYKKLGNIIP